MEFSDNQISAIIGGVIGIAGTILGYLGTLHQTYVARRSRREGVRKMLAHEVQINIRELPQWVSSSTRAVRSNYLWEALRAEAAGLLTDEQVRALSEFYYKQAVVYKKYGDAVPPEGDRNDLIGKGRFALHLLGEAAI